MFDKSLVRRVSVVALFWKRWRCRASLLSLLTVLVFAADAHGSVIFDNSAEGFPEIADGSSAGCPLTLITSVTANTPITSFQIKNELPSGGGTIDYVIFDVANTLTPVYYSAPIAYPADTGETWKTSPNFDFTLLAGHKYYIGGVADVETQYPYQSPDYGYTQDGITSGPDNGRASAGQPPSYISSGGADLPLRLEATVPEPASLTLVGTALLGLGFIYLRRRGADDPTAKA